MKKINRRLFLRSISAIGAGIALRPDTVWAGNHHRFNVKPAILGGDKAFTGAYTRWPLMDGTEDKMLLDALHSGMWGGMRSGNAADRFEKSYAKLLGVDHCLTVNSGTSALYTILGALDIGPGDEVIMPVYTFIATFNSIVLHKALPLIVDIDPESFQVDPEKMEAAITKETKALLPVHIGGSPADLDTILAIGARHKLPVIEDACQAHLAEWKGKKVGGYGIAGAFSFQASKNLTSGQGGAVTSNDEQFMKACIGFHHQGASLSDNPYASGGIRGGNLRLTEFQAAVLSAQMTRLEQQAKKRSENAAYLSKMINEIPGIASAKLYPGTTNSAYHLYMFRYDANHFSGMSKARFMEALRAEGVVCSGGYGQMEKDPRITALTKSRHYLKIYGEKTLNEWLERIQCPLNEKVSKETAVWFTQTVLLGSKTDMEQIAEAIRKVQKYAKEIK
jgi:dTDP-4-amino-4,6-dideoxygalactose transaminase